MFEAYFREKLGPLALRLALGLSSILHGFLKIMISGGMAWHPGMSRGLQLFIAWGEFGAGLAILFGFRCRWAASILLAVTISSQAWGRGWQVLDLPIRTLEPFVMLVLLELALLFVGAGELSLDARSSGGKSSSSSGQRKKMAA